MATELAGIVVLFLAWNLSRARPFPDQTPAAITVYKNPKFYSNVDDQLNYLHGRGSSRYLPGNLDENYKYPGETKKPNVPVTSRAPGIEVTYDSSPEFSPAPRDIPVSTTVPKRRKGPYSPLYNADGDFMDNSEEAGEFREFSKAESLEEDANNREESIDRQSEDFTAVDDNDNYSKKNGVPGGAYGFFNGPIAQDFTGFHEASLRFALPSQSLENSNSYKSFADEDHDAESLPREEWNSEDVQQSREIESNEAERFRYDGHEAHLNEFNAYDRGNGPGSEIRPVTEELDESAETDPSYESGGFHSHEDLSRERESDEETESLHVGDVQMFL